VRIVCSCLNPAIGVGAADGTTSGFVTAIAQLFGGLKKFLGGSASVEYVGTEPEGWSSGATYQLLDSHKRVQNLNPTTVTTLKMPYTNIKAGEIWKIRNRSATAFTVQTNDNSNFVLLMQNTYVVAQALIDSPTTENDWDIIEYPKNVYLAGSTYNSVALNITSAQAGWTQRYGYFMPYLQEGQWRLRFNLFGTYTAANITSLTVSIAGVLFKNSGYAQSCSGALMNSVTNAITRAVMAQPNLGDVIVYISSSGNTAETGISGDCALESKPTWVY